MGDSVVKRVQWALEGGYTSNSASVYNGGAPVVATRRVAVEEAASADWDFIYERVAEARGTYAAVYQSTLHMQSAKGKIPALVYADDLTYVGRMILSGAPTVTTLPAVPTSLLAATAIAATMSLTTQPNVAGDGAAAKILAVTLTNASTSTTAVTVTIAGTSLGGGALSEVVTFGTGTQTPSAVGGGSGALTVTLYTRNYFATVSASGITTSAQPTGDTVAVAGVNAFLWTFLTDMGTSTLLSATAEYFDGTASWQLPGLILDKASFKASMGKSFKLDASCIAQKKAPLAGSTGSINPTALAGDPNAVQNLADAVLPAIPTSATRFYADPVGATPGTTQIAARLTDFGIDYDMQPKLGKSADGTQFPNFVGRAAYGDKLMATMTLLFNSYLGATIDPVELNAFLTNASRTTLTAFPGIALPCGTLTGAGNWPAWAQDANGKGGYYGIAFALAGKYTKVAEKVVDGRTAFEYTCDSEVDLVAIGAPSQVQVISRINPNMK